MTSLTFIFVCVPLPVCQTASGKLPSSEPSRISWQAVSIASARRASSTPSCAFARAAASFTTANARMTSGGIFVGADAEIFEAALRLRAPVTVGRYTHLAHRVMLQTVFHPVTSFRKNLRCRYYTPICPHTASPQTRKSPDPVRTFVCRYSFSLPPAHISPRGAAPRAPGSARRACRSPSSWPSSWDCSGR